MDRAALRYDATNEWLSGYMPNEFASNLAYNFYTPPKRMIVHDPLMGLLEKALYAAVISYLCIEFALAKSHLYLEKPDSRTVFYFDRLQFNSKRNEEWSENNLAYCKDPSKYSYLANLQKYDDTRNVYDPVFVSPVLDPTKPGAGADGYKHYIVAPGTTGNSMLNDDKTSCKQFHLAEIGKVSSNTKQSTRTCIIWLILLL